MYLYGQAVHGADTTKLSGRHRHVGIMPATPSINTPARCAEQVRSRLPCDVRCFVASLENIGACCFVRLCNRSLLLLDKMYSKYDTVTLIELVESRPCLWDKTSEEFKDQELKSKLWLECAPSWSQTSYNWTEKCK